MKRTLSILPLLMLGAHGFGQEGPNAIELIDRL